MPLSVVVLIFTLILICNLAFFYDWFKLIFRKYYISLLRFVPQCCKRKLAKKVEEDAYKVESPRLIVVQESNKEEKEESKGKDEFSKMYLLNVDESSKPGEHDQSNRSKIIVHPIIGMDGHDDRF